MAPMKTSRMYMPLVVSIVAAATVFLGVAGLRYMGAIEFAELAAYDWFVRSRTAPVAPPPPILLIAITEEDIRKQGSWPLSDAAVAAILERLVQYGPRGIGLDIYRDIAVAEGRERLNTVLHANQNIIAAMKFEDGSGTGVRPPSVLAGTQRVGCNDIPLDPGGKVRRGLLYIDDGQHVCPSFALQLALRYLEPEGISPQPDASNPDHLRLGRSTIRPFEPNDGSYVNADARGYQFLLDYREQPGSFATRSLIDLLGDRVTTEEVTDKIVIVGVMADSVKDVFFTPRGKSTGVAIHANIASQLLRAGLDGHVPLRSPGNGAELGWILLWSMAPGLLALRAWTPWKFATVTAGGVLGVSLIAYAAFTYGWWIPVVPPALAWMLSLGLATAYVYKREREERASLMNLFHRHMSPEIADAIWRDRDQFLDGGRPRPQKMTATILFSDLQNYTTVAEGLEPQAFMDWLNEYMEAMVPVVVEHRGIVVRFFGDAIMAAFGAPVARSSESQMRDDAVNAVKCALAMERDLSQLNQRWGRERRSRIGMRIGIHTGPVITGSLGDKHRLEFNIQGDTVNTAQRLESFDKELFAPDLVNSDCRILISKATRDYLGDRIATRELGELKLKGKKNEVAVFRVEGASSGDNGPGPVVD